MTAHIHAKAMADYAEDALKTDKPWELWERCKREGFNVWDNLVTHPGWHEDVLYRRKQVQNLDEAVYPKITAFKLLKQIDQEAAKYIKDNGFKKKLNKWKDLRGLFIFNETNDGHFYWCGIQERLKDAIKEHGI